MNILLNGHLGKMGQELQSVAGRGDLDSKIVCKVDPGAVTDAQKGVFSSLFEIPEAKGIDAIIDFSYHGAILPLLEYASFNSIPTLIATTGHTAEELSVIKKYSHTIPILHCANASLGMAYLKKMAELSSLFFKNAEIEIIERHDRRKADSPSGSALLLAKTMSEARPESYIRHGRCGYGAVDKNEIGIHSVRISGAVGEHEIVISTEGETVSLRHTVSDRAIFAKGALMLAARLIDCAPGLYFADDFFVFGGE